MRTRRHLVTGAVTVLLTAWAWPAARVPRAQAAADLLLVNGKVITVRGDDTRAIAAMLDVPVDQVGNRLDALDLLYRP